MVRVDTVYQRVLAIANKEQRGYITPLEFNLYANQAQMDIFEQYFYDLNQFLRVPGNDTEYSDVVNMIEEKINIFETFGTLTYQSPGYDISTLGNLYRLGNVELNGVEIEKLEYKDFSVIDKSPLTRPTLDRPVYYKQGNLLYVNPATIVSGINVFFIRTPLRAEWGYVVTNEKALHHAGRSTNFELHASEETDLVVKILALAGITTDDQVLYQIASQEDIKNVQQEKK